jgi:hypothetical protein
MTFAFCRAIRSEEFIIFLYIETIYFLNTATGVFAVVIII